MLKCMKALYDTGAKDRGFDLSLPAGAIMKMKLPFAVRRKYIQ